MHVWISSFTEMVSTNQPHVAKEIQGDSPFSYIRGKDISKQYSFLCDDWQVFAYVRHNFFCK